MAMDDIAMDFVVGLPRTWRGKDVVRVVLGRLSKVALFIHIRTIDFASYLAPIWEIVRLRRVPKTITSGRDAKFVSKILESLQSALGT
jgi:hypothetical protein